jgi:hypothetical protein
MVRGRFGACSVSGIYAGVKRVDASAGPGLAGDGFFGRNFHPAALCPCRVEVGVPGCEQDRRAGLRVEALGAQRRRFHMGSLGEGLPEANGSEARSALGHGIVHARRRNARVTEAGPGPARSCCHVCSTRRWPSSLFRRGYRVPPLMRAKPCCRRTSAMA